MWPSSATQRRHPRARRERCPIGASRANLYAIGNPDLKPERIETWESVVAVRPTHYLGLEVSYFHSSLLDEIGRQGVSPAHYANVGKSRTQGVESRTNGHVLADFYWHLSYTYQWPRDAISGNRLPYVRAQRATGGLSYAPPGFPTLHADVLWTGSRPRASGDTRSQVPTHTTVDLTVTAFALSRRLAAQLAIHNLFNKQFTDPDTSGSANSVPGDFPREGISVMANLRLKLERQAH